MPAKVTTRIVWRSKEELAEAKKKGEKFRNFSEFVRTAIEAYPDE
ncbi:hypothetical protein [Symmachiella dynata]|nr:hypothetical protein [Symmachiella dynata]